MLKTVFFPKNCRRAPAGILIGTSNGDNTILYVVAVVHFPVTPKNLNSYLSSHQNCKKLKDIGKENKDHVTLRPLGTWSPSYSSNESRDDSFTELVPKLFARKLWVTVKGQKDQDGNDSFFVEHSEADSKSERDIFSEKKFICTNEHTVLVFYDQEEIWDGEFTDCALLRSDLEAGSIEALFAVIHECKSGILSYESGLDLPNGITATHCCVRRELSLAVFLLSIFTTFALMSLHLLMKTVHAFWDKLPTVIRFLVGQTDKIAQLSSFCCHVKKRYTVFIQSLTAVFQNGIHIPSKHTHRNVIASVFADIMLGLFLLVILQYCNLWSTRTTKNVFLPYVDSIAKQVEELVEWLMGIPAGLKLNSPLNQFLGRFFLYHVRLWLEYAKMMMDFFPHLITYCLMSSCLGLSFFLSVVADAISTLSFHVYCFYVYAGRLYGLQVSGLMSLWRLFRGKKWNPLRKRVDSLEESGQRADQLFAGTLLFTVLLFLLPTTALYYSIFMLLRVAVLAMQILLSYLVFLCSEFPWYSFVLRLFQAHKFIKSVRITWIGPTLPHEYNEAQQSSEHTNHQPNEAISLHMRVEAQSLVKVVTLGLSEKWPQPDGSAGIKSLLKKIVVGDLVKWS